jgi:hypothetical protein
MKKLLVLLFVVNFSFAQDSMRKTFFGFSGGRTFMGSGDLRGYNLGFGVQRQIRKHFALETNLRASAASGNYLALGFQSNPQNNELRFTTAGVQLELLPLVPIVNRKLKISLLAGPVFRYQVNSFPLMYGFSDNSNSTAISVRYDQPYKEISLGFIGQMEAAVRIWQKNYLGLRLAGHRYSQDLNWYMPVVYFREI